MIGELPSHRCVEEYMHLVDTQDVTLIVGATGCGKSTQLPKFLDGNVVCTQPRRLA